MLLFAGPVDDEVTRAPRLFRRRFWRREGRREGEVHLAADPPFSSSLPPPPLPSIERTLHFSSSSSLLLPLQITGQSSFWGGEGGKEKRHSHIGKEDRGRGRVSDLSPCPNRRRTLFLCLPPPSTEQPPKEKHIQHTVGTAPPIFGAQAPS